MADDLKDLIEQAAIIVSMKRVLANFKIIGKANMTCSLKDYNFILPLI